MRHAQCETEVYIQFHAEVEVRNDLHLLWH